MVKRANFSLTMCNLRSKQGTLQKFIRKKFCSFKKYTYLCGDSFHHAFHLHSEPGWDFCFLQSQQPHIQRWRLGGLYYATLAFDYKSQKLQEKFDCFEYSAYLCYNNKRKESYMETKDKKIQVHTIDNKDIDKFFPAHSEISSKGRKHTVKLFSR